jgi:hypothetical protein
MARTRGGGSGKRSGGTTQVGSGEQCRGAWQCGRVGGDSRGMVSENESGTGFFRGHVGGLDSRARRGRTFFSAPSGVAPRH